MLYHKTFEDGSELTTTDIVGAMIVGAIGAGIITAAKIKYDDWKTRRIMKKYGWPEDTFKVK